MGIAFTKDLFAHIENVALTGVGIAFTKDLFAHIENVALMGVGIMFPLQRTYLLISRMFPIENCWSKGLICSY